MNKPKRKKIDFSLGRRDLIWNKCCEKWEKYLIIRLEKMLKMLPPRNGQEKNAMELLKNWKEHISSIEQLIEEMKAR